MAESRRLALQVILEELLGSSNVYFQPPRGLNISYPAIVYNIDSSMTEYANGKPYKIQDRYHIQYIDRKNNLDVHRKIQELPMTRFTSYFSTDGLNHYNYTIHY